MLAIEAKSESYEEILERRVHRLETEVSRLSTTVNQLAKDGDTETRGTGLGFESYP